MAEDVEHLSFTGHGGQTLAARLHLPPGPVRAYALFAHCFTCGKDLPAAVRISDALAVHGIATLRFDFTGLGESEGDFADTHFTSSVDDLTAAADHMREHHGAPTILIGHSLGGAAVLAAAHRIAEVRAVATMGAPFAPSHIEHLLAPAREELSQRGEAEVTIAGRSFRVKQSLIDDLEARHPGETLRKLRAALLIMHSPTDEVVDIDNARRIYEAALHPKSFVTLDGAKHLLPRRTDVQYAADILATWARRYVPEPEGEADPPEEGEIDVHGRQTLLQQIHGGKHSWLADEPVRVGGTNQGPTPYDLLLAALGACTSMTVRMYASHKGWPLRAVRVRLSHKRVHAEDCENCEEKGRKVDRMDRELTLEGELDDDQRARLLEIANRCPVHRTLTGQIHIETQLMER